jgi:hypothetical protein
MINIIKKVRDLIGDLLVTTGRDVFTYESVASSKIFTLTESNVTPSTIVVLKNGSVWAGTNYSYSTSTGKLTVTGTLAVGNTLEVTYSYYTKYSDNELKGQIRSALSYISVEKYKTFSTTATDNTIIFPTPSETEEYLIAVIAAILIKGDIISYRTPELSISFERGDSKEKKIKKAIRNFKKSFGCLEYIDLADELAEEEEEEEDC